MNKLELVTITIISARYPRDKTEISFIGWPTQRDVLKAIGD